MPRFLLINGSSLQLAPHVDHEDLLRELAEAARSGELVEVPAILRDRLPGDFTVYVNPAGAAFWGVADEPDPDQ